MELDQVVVFNIFFIGYSNDTLAELNMVKEFALKNGAFKAVLCDHWAKGGLGALELADAVIDACDSSSKFSFLYPLQLSIQDKIQIIAKEMYGAGQVQYTEEVLEKIKTFTEKVCLFLFKVSHTLNIQSTADRFS